MGERIDGRRLRYQHRRGELLQAVAEYVLENGVATLTLRRAAAAVGVSHATLQHHFGTREELVEEIVGHLLERTFSPGEDYPEGVTAEDVEMRLRLIWEGLKSPTGRQDTRLFTEVLIHSLFVGPTCAPGVTHSIEQRLERLAELCISAGCPESEAIHLATIMIALLRGLSLDLLATEDTERLDATFELILLDTTHRVRHWSANRRPATDAASV